MKALHAMMAVSLIALSTASYADRNRGHDRGHDRGAGQYTDWARVTRVTPQYERVNMPRQVCSNEIVYSQAPGHRGEEGRSYGGAVIGGIAGGILGNQVGRGDGRTAATAAGAVVGAIVGDRLGNGGHRPSDYETTRAREVQRCHSVEHWENRLTGYHVEYEYNGYRYTQFMNDDPGRRIRVRVSVTPA